MNYSDRRHKTVSQDDSVYLIAEFVKIFQIIALSS